jgi:flagellar export protein FliJ
MARFIFKLQAVLTQRQAAERRCQAAVAVLERERAAVEARIRELQRAIVAARDDVRAGLAGGEGTLDIRGVRLAAGASLHLVARAQRAVIELSGVHGRLDAARVQLLRAATRRRAVELLRERRYEEWLSEERRREDAALDEIGVMHAARKEGE